MAHLESELHLSRRIITVTRACSKWFSTRALPTMLRETLEPRRGKNRAALALRLAAWRPPALTDTLEEAEADTFRGCPPAEPPTNWDLLRE
jgi:hypothetical protein